MSLDELGIPDSFKTDIDRSCDILRSFGAREVYLFGSLSRGSWNDHSDLDLAVRGLQIRFEIDQMESLQFACARYAPNLVFDKIGDRGTS